VYECYGCMRGEREGERERDVRESVGGGGC
jgi:hypothetical protein